ncbi:MAG TPA: hypothetical protein VH415_09150 [Nitrososphaeraceae archaeon]
MNHPINQPNVAYSANLSSNLIHSLFSRKEIYRGGTGRFAGENGIDSITGDLDEDEISGGSGAILCQLFRKITTLHLAVLGHSK